MNGFKTAALELWGLFVDNGPFALAILGWIATVWVVLPRLGVPAALDGPLLGLGLAATLAASALVAAGR